MRIELQFSGYRANVVDYPLSASPFDGIDDAQRANEIIAAALMGDEDGDGWVSTETETGEDFQVRYAD